MQKHAEKALDLRDVSAAEYWERISAEVACLDGAAAPDEVATGRRAASAGEPKMLVGRAADAAVELLRLLAHLYWPTFAVWGCPTTCRRGNPASGNAS